MASGISVRLPLTVSPRDGLYTLNQTLNQSVAQNLKHIILTAPGERAMDLNFGVGLRNYLFEPLTELTYDAIRERILKQISIYMSFVRVQGLDLTSNEESNMLSIKLAYSFPGNNLSQVLNVEAR
tara:strand:+ start:729 stop:1103 length:375 start_codon:yes stop_codon:yes gene_type:complete